MRVAGWSVQEVPADARTTRARILPIHSAVPSSISAERPPICWLSAELKLRSQTPELEQLAQRANDELASTSRLGDWIGLFGWSVLGQGEVPRGLGSGAGCGVPGWAVGQVVAGIQGVPAAAWARASRMFWPARAAVAM